MARKAPASRKLHLGCGYVHKDSWVNLDYIKTPAVDVIWNLEKGPYPFPDDHFTEVEAHHVLEHLPDTLLVMGELCRICKDGARLRFGVPYFASPAYDLDPTHRRKFNIQTFGFFSDGHPQTGARVRIVRQKLFYFSSRSFMRSRWYSLPIDTLINLAPTIYQRFFVYLLPASEMHVELDVVKNEKKKR